SGPEVPPIWWLRFAEDDGLQTLVDRTSQPNLQNLLVDTRTDTSSNCHQAAVKSRMCRLLGATNWSARIAVGRHRSCAISQVRQLGTTSGWFTAHVFWATNPFLQVSKVEPGRLSWPSAPLIPGRSRPQ